MTLFRKTLLPIILLTVCPALHAQQITAHAAITSDNYHFWTYTPPDYDSTTATKPLILFLHGASLRGSNMDLALRYGPTDAIRRGLDIDALIVTPQCPARQRWEPEKLIQLLNWVVQHYAVDTNRLYVFGMSLGGYGALDFVGAYPHRIAAAIAMCGGSHQKSYCGLNQLPLWIIHGTADHAVTLAQSEKVVRAMEQCGSTERLIFTKLEGQNHGALARIFYLPEPYRWLLSHNLADERRPAQQGFSISTTDMRNAYKHLTRKSIPTQPLPRSSAPVEVAQSQPAPAPTATPKKATPQYHVVKQGDTLYRIAKNNHTTVAQLCKLNNIKETTTLSIGRKLRVR